jgi:chemotaxis signal transduction protein
VKELTTGALWAEGKEGVGLGCLVGPLHLFIPFDNVQQVVTYRVTGPLPLARPHLAGVAFWADRAVMSVNLDTTLIPSLRETVAVVLRTHGSTTTWAFEVTMVKGMSRVRVGAHLEAADVPPWILAGELAERQDQGQRHQPVAWLDVDKMVTALSTGDEV